MYIELDIKKYKYNRGLYSEKCLECGKLITLRSQRLDGDPEYYTDVWVKCPKCGEEIYFNLPVN